MNQRRPYYGARLGSARWPQCAAEPGRDFAVVFVRADTGQWVRVGRLYEFRASRVAENRAKRRLMAFRGVGRCHPNVEQWPVDLLATEPVHEIAISYAGRWIQSEAKLQRQPQSGEQVLAITMAVGEVKPDPVGGGDETF